MFGLITKGLGVLKKAGGGLLKKIKAKKASKKAAKAAAKVSTVANQNAANSVSSAFGLPTTPVYKELENVTVTSDGKPAAEHSTLLDTINSFFQAKKTSDETGNPMLDFSQKVKLPSIQLDHNVDNKTNNNIKMVGIGALVLAAIYFITKKKK